jgi:hypothetical protein
MGSVCQSPRLSALKQPALPGTPNVFFGAVCCQRTVHVRSGARQDRTDTRSEVVGTLNRAASCSARPEPMKNAAVAVRLRFSSGTPATAGCLRPLRQLSTKAEVPSSMASSTPAQLGGALDPCGDTANARPRKRLAGTQLRAPCAHSAAHSAACQDCHQSRAPTALALTFDRDAAYVAPVLQPLVQGEHRVCAADCVLRRRRRRGHGRSCVLHGLAAPPDCDAAACHLT